MKLSLSETLDAMIKVNNCHRNIANNTNKIIGYLSQIDAVAKRTAERVNAILHPEVEK